MADKRIISISQTIKLRELARIINLQSIELINFLVANGINATPNDLIDFETASLVAEEYNLELRLIEQLDQDRPSKQTNTIPQTLESRPPIVVIMGHVDHGKTTLLDYIRSARVAASESGGITQHISSYQIGEADNKITFIDTPGHEAFGALRAHGARLTDIVILVVAADDGVKPQTKEVIELVKSNKLPLIVAINKIDKPSVDSSKVKQELSEQGIIAEDWGGDTPMLDISAKTGQGIDQLLELIHLVNQLNPAQADYKIHGEGIVLESELATGQGPLATILVRHGNFKIGDYIVSGKSWGKIRSITGTDGQSLKQALPSMPVILSGLKDIPEFAKWIEVVPNQKAAKSWLEQTSKDFDITKLATTEVVDFKKALQKQNRPELRLLIKADSQGSLIAIEDSILRLASPDVDIVIVDQGIGPINETDIRKSSSSEALLIGFHSKFSSPMIKLAKQLDIEYKTYTIIYELIEDIEQLVKELSPDREKQEVAKLQVKGVFYTKSGRVVTGGEVVEGTITPNLELRIYRDDQMVGEGKLLSIQVGPDPVEKAEAGQECGLAIQSETKTEIGDQIIFLK
ncbi:translation initiation factor IF-2 [Candidatus Saccharibacteria bacterium]|nr:translation initiation factor IF-2 [Candidatus Saccharibacteria bacterium]MCB9834931.1 translation initiation factor IF-2 [Candidatus Nomurabacteria bacterium]